LPGRAEPVVTTVAQACARKPGYLSEQVAKNAAYLATLDRNQVCDGPLFTYHCPSCGDWHLTSKPQEET
ncbi:MAG: hypothetical protein JWO15_3727, partial [Sphingomonadales bacterium]|nr:hypothetical protein [Sphingomonadales bacterium]